MVLPINRRNPRLERDAFGAAGCVRIFEDKIFQPRHHPHRTP